MARRPFSSAAGHPRPCRTAKTRGRLSGPARLPIVAAAEFLPMFAVACSTRYRVARKLTSVSRRTAHGQRDRQHSERTDRYCTPRVPAQKPRRAAQGVAGEFRSFKILQLVARSLHVRAYFRPQAIYGLALLVLQALQQLIGSIDNALQP